MRPFLLVACLALAVSACSRGEDPDGLFGGPGAAAGGIDPSATELAALSNPGNIDINSIEFFSQVIGDRVFFEVDQTNLTAAARGTLDLQAKWLASRPNAAITVEGHADEQGTRDYNLRLDPAVWQGTAGCRML